MCSTFAPAFENGTAVLKTGQASQVFFSEVKFFCKNFGNSKICHIFAVRFA